MLGETEKFSKQTIFLQSSLLIQIRICLFLRFSTKNACQCLRSTFFFGGGVGCLCVREGVNSFNRLNFPGKVCKLFILLPNFVVNLSM